MKARIPKSPAGGNMLEQIQKMQEDMQKKQAELEQQRASALLDSYTARSTKSRRAAACCAW